MELFNSRTTTSSLPSLPIPGPSDNHSPPANNTMAKTKETNSDHFYHVGATRQALQEERQIRADMEVLQNQMCQLRRSAKKLERRAETLESLIAKNVLSCAKFDCQKFCDAVYRTLPREIRDMIYGHIHPAQYLTVTSHELYSWQNVSTSYFKSTSESHCRTGHDIKNEHHLWDVDFMGAGILRELVESFFRTCTFKFGQHWSHIPSFRVSDQWKIGFVPADFVTNVEIGIQCRDYDFTRTYNDQQTRSIDSWGVCHGDYWGDDDAGGWGVSDSYRSSKSTCSKLLAKMEHLFGFRQGTKVNILILDSEYPYQVGIDTHEIILGLLPTLHRLEAVGSKINLEIPRDSSVPFNIAVGTMAPDIETFQREFAKLEMVEKVMMEKMAEEEEARVIALELADEDARGDAFAGSDGDDESEEE